jgi:hypothetical protein
MIASSRNREPVSWFFAGAFFGIVALLAVGFMPALEPSTKDAPSTEDDASIPLHVRQLSSSARKDMGY